MIDIFSILSSAINIAAIAVSGFFIYKLKKNGGNRFINAIAISLLVCNIILILNFSLFYFFNRKVLLIFIFQVFTFSLGLLYGPIVYLYIKAIAKGQLRRRRKDLLHFIPVIIFIIYFTNSFGITKRNIFRLKADGTLRFQDVLVGYLMIFIIHGLVYLGMSVPHLLNMKKDLIENSDETKESIYIYMRVVAFSFVMLLSLNIFCFLILYSKAMTLVISNFVAVAILSFLFISSKKPHIFYKPRY